MIPIDPEPTAIQTLLNDIRRCRACAADLPLGPKPIFVADARARILIAGQAPGRRAHQSGIPWSDASGDLLRAWLGVDKEVFYDPRCVALVPMGFCYPGATRSGDRPPRRDCAVLWHRRLLPRLERIELQVIVGRYAHAHHVPHSIGRSVTETVAGWRDLAPTRFPLPHPSPRNRLWLRRNPWFESELLPSLRLAVDRVLHRKQAAPRTSPRATRRQPATPALLGAAEGDRQA